MPWDRCPGSLTSKVLLPLTEVLCGKEVFASGWDTMMHVGMACRAAAPGQWWRRAARGSIASCYESLGPPAACADAPAWSARIPPPRPGCAATLATSSPARCSLPLDTMRMLNCLLTTVTHGNATDAVDATYVVADGVAKAMAGQGRCVA